MNDPVNSTDPSTEAPTPQPAVARAFCALCGAALLGADGPCVCAARVQPVLPSAPSLFGPLRFALATYFLLLLAGMGLAIALYIAGEDISPEFEVRAELTFDAVFAAITLVACLMRRREIRPLLARPKQSRWFLYAAGLSLVTYALGAVVAGFWGSIFGASDEPYYTDAVVRSGMPIAVAFLSIAVMPGIFEELAFRGVIGTSLARVLDTREAVVVTALLFASIHLNALMFVNLLWIGLVLALLLSRSGSLLPCMLLHFCHNALCVVDELVPGFPG